MTSLTVEALGAAADAVERHLESLVANRFASRLFAQDSTLWGEAAQAEASIRLAWTGLARSSRPLVGEIAALREQLRERGVQRIVLCGMGGSSLAPEVICATAGQPLVVLDSSDPDMVAAAVAEDLAITAVVVSSKSGSTLETDSQRRAFVQAFSDAGIDPRERIVIVTDPGSPLDQDSRADGYRVVNADPQVGGRYSALTAFGLVPSGLAGVDIEELLDEVEAVSDLLAEDDPGNPGLRLGAALAGTSPLRDKVLFTDAGSGIVGLADWAEQLIAESTGKEGTGILPVVCPPGSDPLAGITDPSDCTVVVLADEEYLDREDSALTIAEAGAQVNVAGSLGAQLLLWEVATAVAGHLLGINPFDQPDVESAKQAARDIMAAGSAAGSAPAAVDGAVQIRALGPDWLAAGSPTLDDAVDALLRQLDPQSGYLAVMVYLDRIAHADLADLQSSLIARTGRPVTFGWGPRFLHSTGQYHKGGPAQGVYLQVTGTPESDLSVPGREYTFGEFIAAQAAGDAQVLADHGRSVLRVHLADLAGGLQQLRDTLSR